MKRGLLALAGTLVAVVVLGAVWLAWSIADPAQVDLALPDGVVDARTTAGEALLAASLSADHQALERHFQAQEKATWCAVASAVTVLNARGMAVTQDGFFTEAVEAVRPWWRTTLMGTPVGTLGEMMRVHGVDATVVHASERSLGDFTEELIRNMVDPGDQLIVNYDRGALGEVGSGHVSPVGAYDSGSDKVLVLDVAAHKYPPHWVDVEALFRAMATTDPESGESRGWVVVR